MADDSDATRRKPNQRYRNRQIRILQEAVDILNRKGIKGMKLSDLAARLDLVPTAVMYYYKNKEALAVACMHSGLERYHELLDHAERVPKAEGVREFTRRYFDLVRQIELGEAPALPVFNEVRALNVLSVNESYIHMFKRVRRLIDGSAGKRLGRIDRNVRAHQFLVQILWADFWLKTREVDEYSRLAERFLDVLVHGYVDEGRDWTFPQVSADEVLLIVQDKAKEEFLRIATQLMNIRGYKGASLDKISARLNVTKGAFYHHYQTKDELAMACFERTVELILKAQSAGEARGRTGAEKLAISLTLLIEHQLAGGVPIIRLSAFASMPPELSGRIFRRFDQLTLRFSGVIADGVADGSIRPVDPLVGAQMVTGTLVAVTDAQFWAADLTAENARDTYIRPLISGIFT